MLLETKLLKPRLPSGLITRSAVLDTLDRALEHPLTLICAPAGYGKTTLAAHWLEERRILHAWVSLDERENRAGAFWYAVCAALGRIERRFFDRVWPSFGTRDHPDTGAGIALLVRELVDYSRTWKSPRRLVLVLDDFQCITDTEVLGQFSYFLDYSPDLLRCLLTTRTDPALELARRRVRNQLHEVRAAQLRFDLPATGQFLTERLGLHLAQTDLHLLYDRTEGWPAAVQLAGLSILASGDSNGAIRNFDSRNWLLSDYLLEEVFRRQPLPLQVFLRRIAFLPRFCAGLCDAALGQADSRARIQELLQRNLLIQPVDAAGVWFRLHDLFREWLCQTSLPEAQERLLRERSAHWLESQGLWLDALDQWLALQHWQRAEQTVAKGLGHWQQQGLIFHAERHLDRFPQESIGASPWLCLLKAFALFLRGNHEGTVRALDQAERVLSQLQTGPGTGTGSGNETSADTLSTAGSPSQATAAAAMSELRPQIALIRSQLARFSGDFSAAAKIACEVETELLNRESALHVWLLHGKGVDAFMAGKVGDAVPILTRAMGLAVDRRDLVCQIATLSWLVPALIHQGEYASGWAWIDQVQQEIGQDWRAHPWAAMLPCYRASILRERNQLAAAEQALAQAQELVRDQLMPMQLIYLAFLRWSLSMNLNRFEAAEQAVDDIEKLHALQAVEWTHVLIEPRLMRAITRLAHDDISSFFMWMQDFDAAGHDGPPMRRWVEELIWLRAQIAIGQDVAASLHRLRREAEQGQVRLWVIRTWILEALAAARNEDSGRITQCLVTAIRLAQPQRFERTFLDEGPQLIPLLQRCVQVPAVAAQVRQLLAAFDQGQTLAAKALPASPVASASPPLVLAEPISEREHQVLVLLASGLTNQALAQALGISPATVKAHLRNIFGKLDARNRTQALAKARSLQLLS